MASSRARFSLYQSGPQYASSKPDGSIAASASRQAARSYECGVCRQ
ncbi:hypothetical protein [Streptomyces goshikiensis]